MPPKKTGVAAAKAKAKAKAAATPPRATRTSVPDTVTTSRGKEYDTTAALSRPRRESAFITTAATPSKKRGRPARKASGAVVEDAEDEVEPPKKRGRPAKKVADPVKKRGPGRPVKKVEDEMEVDEEDEAAGEEETDEPVAAPKARGPPPKKPVDEAKVPVKAAPNATKKRGRPSKAATAINGEVEEDAVESVEKDVDMVEQTASDRQYWLMKAEQEDREETLANGEVFNTKFTIDDLKSKDGPEPWDGVRNPTAAKNMRAMKKGDLAFFYASGGKSGRKPGITGIMEIVKEHEFDQTTSDEGAYGYVKEEKARGKWCVVHVEYRNKLSRPVHLSELQKYMEGSGVLGKMQVLKQSRLSVTSVSEAEWNFITKNLIEGFEEVDALPGAEGADGTSNLEEESTLITTEHLNGKVIINESTQPEQDLPQGNVTAEPLLATTESDVPSTDTIFPAETSQTSRPASRGGSREPSLKAKATTSRQSSRATSVAAGSLALPATSGRGRTRTPSGLTSSAILAKGADVNGSVGMPAIGEGEE